MISWRSFKSFVYINGSLMSLSVALHYCVSSVFVSTFIKNGVLLLFLYNSMKDKKDIQTHDEPTPIESWKDLVLFGTTTLLQATTHWYILQGGYTNTTVIFFLNRLFLFEICMDLGHYVMHRALHTRLLYPIHKMHHHYPKPTLLNTFYHNPVDLFLLDCLPTYASILLLQFCFGSFTPLQLQMVFVYKSFVEIAGHSGKHSVPTGSFPLCIWLPRNFGISLYTEDHDLHHKTGHCNYAKRFSLWDRVGGTYSGP